MRVQCAKEQNTMSGLKPRLLDPETSTLMITPPCLHAETMALSVILADFYFPAPANDG